ncbi:hypothetical protein K402DRAFT_418300 [Aulographum hederae CBS 113979]|uniref:Uncharacterized protein n=1 Tax=Aulographum hederae CBS 113979 TaxID=1176131 RepID=A0A6G1H9D5_9PEZI|nr:hypothetical protein K402DRAFT_418300 [Aulographum hederae CBS 113979]
MFDHANSIPQNIGQKEDFAEPQYAYKESDMELGFVTEEEFQRMERGEASDTKMSPVAPLCYLEPDVEKDGTCFTMDNVSQDDEDSEDNNIAVSKSKKSAYYSSLPFDVNHSPSYPMGENGLPDIPDDDVTRAPGYDRHDPRPKWNWSDRYNARFFSQPLEEQEEPKEPKVVPPNCKFLPPLMAEEKKREKRVRFADDVSGESEIAESSHEDFRASMEELKVEENGVVFVVEGVGDIGSAMSTVTKPDVETGAMRDDGRTDGQNPNLPPQASDFDPTLTGDVNRETAMSLPGPPSNENLKLTVQCQAPNLGKTGKLLKWKGPPKVVLPYPTREEEQVFGEETKGYPVTRRVGEFRKKMSEEPQHLFDK